MNPFPQVHYSDVGRVVAGQHIAAALYNGNQKGTPYLTGPADFGAIRPVVTKWTMSPKVMAKRSDVLLTVKGNGVGKSNLGEDAAIGRQLMALRPDASKLDQNYLFQFLRSRIHQINALGQGATVPGVAKGDIEGLQIPLPPLPEQRRIAAILDQADAIRRKRQKGIELTEKFLKSAFVTMFLEKNRWPIQLKAEHFVLPKGWKAERLTNVAKLESGHTPSRTVPEYWDGPYSWVNLSEIRRFDGKIAVETKSKVTELGLANSSARLLPKGTVCLARTASVGFATIMGQEMSTSQDFVNWVCGPKLLPEYLLFALVMSRPWLKRIANGSTHKTIYVPTVQNFSCIIPPIPLQEKFAKLYHGTQNSIARLESGPVLADNLFNSLVQRAFRGELSPVEVP